VLGVFITVSISDSLNHWVLTNAFNDSLKLALFAFLSSIWFAIDFFVFRTISFSIGISILLFCHKQRFHISEVWQTFQFINVYHM
jgi:hypothetical protein